MSCKYLKYSFIIVFNGEGFVAVIKCKTDDACSEEEHELNRRSEFVIKNL